MYVDVNSRTDKGDSPKEFIESFFLNISGQYFLLIALKNTNASDKIIAESILPKNC